MERKRTEKPRRYIAEEVANVYELFRKHFIQGANHLTQDKTIVVDENTVISGESYVSTTPTSPTLLKVHYEEGRFSGVIFKAYDGVVKMTEFTRDCKPARVVVIREEARQLVSRFVRNERGTYVGEIHHPVPPIIYESIGGYH